MRNSDFFYLTRLGSRTVLVSLFVGLVQQFLCSFALAVTVNEHAPLGIKELQESGFIHSGSTPFVRPYSRWQNGADDDAFSIQHWILLSNRRLVGAALLSVKAVARGKDGHLQYDVLDAIRISDLSGYRILDSVDTNCVSSTQPELSVVVIGKLKWRPTPLVGAYAYSIRYAWVLDAKTKRLSRVSREGVACSFDDDRD